MLDGKDRMMRILFVNPPWVKRDGNVWKNIACVMPPLGLAWMASVLEKHGHQVLICDAHAERLPMDQIANSLAQLGHFDLVGITATTPIISNALEIARQARRLWPACRLVMGGVHPTVLPDETLAEPAVDVVVRGEGEITITDLAAHTPFAEIRGISYRQAGKIIHNPDQILIEDLDSLPMPAYHLLPMDKYYPSAGAAKRLPAVSMLATRGCPGRCTFCYRIFGNKLRVRSGRKVAEEVKHLQDTYGIKEICFYDDTFTVFKKEVHAFCQRLEELHVNLTWSCFSRVDTIDQLLLDDMKAHGCHQIMYGIESASPEILANVGKRADLDKARRAVAITKKAGIDVRAAYMLGNPGETLETMQQTLDFAIELDTDVAIFNIATPFPGTDMFQWAKSRGLLTTENWDEYDFANPVMKLPTVSLKQIHEFYQRAYRKFFLRPKYLARRVARLRHLVSVVDAFRGLRAVMNT